MHRKPLLSSSSATRRMPVAAWSATLLAVALLTAGCLAASGVSAAEPDTARAVLKPQEIGFYYQSFTSFYSCDGLESKLKRILKALGANQDVDVEARGCDAGSGSQIARSPYVTIRIISPVEATPQALAELEKGRAQRELAAKVRGNRGKLTDAEAQFQGTWKPVSLSRGQLGLEPGDCELIDELRKKVLPKLGVRIVKDGVQCTPNQINRSQPRLEVEALVQPPPKQTGAPGTAVEGKAAEPAATESPPAAAEPQANP